MFSVLVYKLVENEKLMTLLLFFVVSRKSILEELKLSMDVYMDASELSGNVSRFVFFLASAADAIITFVKSSFVFMDKISRWEEGNYIHLSLLVGCIMTIQEII